MKKRFVSILLSLSLVAVPCTALTVGAAGTDTVTQKTVPAYLYGMDKQTELECVFTQELPEVVYIAPEDYLNHIYTTTNVQTKNADGTYSVTSENGTIRLSDSILTNSLTIRKQTMRKWRRWASPPY